MLAYKMKKEAGDSRRVARVEREIQHTVAQFLISGFKLPLPGIVTVSRVIMPGDLRTAKVFISVLGDPKDMDKAVEILQERSFEVQRFIGQELKMRYCPKLTFFPDHNTQEVLKVERILQTLEEERQLEAKRAAKSDGTTEHEGDVEAPTNPAAAAIRSAEAASVESNHHAASVSNPDGKDENT
jgi:ribosome-binding factor A